MNTAVSTELPRRRIEGVLTAPCFPVAIEAIHLAVPFIVGVVLLFSQSPRLESLLVGLLALQLSHTALTYLLLARLPEMKDWMNSATRVWGPKSLPGWALSVGMLFGFVFLFRIGAFFMPALRGEIFLLMLAWVTAFLQYHHIFGQNLGFQAIYDQRLRASTGVPVSERFRQREKSLMSWMFWMGAAQVFMFPILRFGLKRLGYDIGLSEFFYYTGLSLMLFPVFILANTLLSGFSFLSAKFIYQVRLFFWPLSFLNPKWGLVLIAAHGIEYAFLCRQMVNNSRASAVEKKDFWSTAVVIVLLFSVLGLPAPYMLGWWLGPNLPEWRGLFNLAGAFSLFVSFHHYYLDGVLFRMKDPEVRKLIGPLLGQRG